MNTYNAETIWTNTQYEREDSIWCVITAMPCQSDNKHECSRRKLMSQMQMLLNKH